MKELKTLRKHINMSVIYVEMESMNSSVKGKYIIPLIILCKSVVENLIDNVLVR